MSIKKILGFSLYSCIGKHLPTSYSHINIWQKFFRQMCAKLMLPSCGHNVNIEHGASFSTRCTIGDNSGIGINAKLGVCYIGNNVMMGPECVAITRNHNFSDISVPMCQQGFTEEQPITICDDVWIGYRVTLLPGITIGKGAIIGAGSVVTHDVKEYDIVAGNPAKTIRSRKEP